MKDEGVNGVEDVTASGVVREADRGRTLAEVTRLIKNNARRIKTHHWASVVAAGAEKKKSTVGEILRVTSSRGRFVGSEMEGKEGVAAGARAQGARG